MKKLLSIISICPLITISTINVTSCLDIKNNVSDKIDEIINKIKAIGEINLRGDNLGLSLSDSLIRKTILNKLGLTTDEQQYVVNLEGQLKEREVSEIKINLSVKPTQKIATRSINIKVYLENNNTSFADKYDISKANNIAILPNNKQITLSGIQNAAPVSDSNLNVNDNYFLDDNCGSPADYVYIFNSMYLAAANSCSKQPAYGKIATNDQGEYSKFTYETHISSIGGTNLITSSSNHLYLINDDNKLFEIRDVKDVINISLNKTLAPLVIKNVYNTGSKLYIATTRGLYFSNDEKTFQLIKSTQDYNINSIVASKDGSKLFFGTQANGVWYSNDNGNNFTQIKDTNSTEINKNSLFISSTDNVYFGIENNGLWKTDINGDSALQLVSPNISKSSNIKNIVQYYDGTLIALTNEKIVYLYEF